MTIKHLLSIDLNKNFKMKLIVVYIFSSFFVLNSLAIDLTITLTSIPSNTPLSDQIYICGSFNSWEVGASNSIIQVQTNGTRKIVITNVSGSIEYKLNRGHWDTPDGTTQGGFISLYCVAAYPSTFGKARIFSPSIWFARIDVMNYINGKNFTNTTLRLYFLGGTTESSTMVADMQTARNAFVLKGDFVRKAKLMTHTEGAHSEWYWKREFGAAFTFLFPASSVSSTESKNV